MKKIILTLAFLFILSHICVPTEAKGEFFAPVCIKVNSEYVKTNNHAYLKNGRTFVSLRDFGDIFSCAVSWNESTSTAKITKNSTEISVTKGKKEATVNEKKVKLDSASQIVNDRMYVPLRFLSETLGASVSWNEKTLTANVKSAEASVPAHLKGKSPYTDDELYWLSKIVSAEAKGEVNTGKTAVANVILNRVESNEFPDTIYGVIFDNKYGVQFTPTSDGSIYNTATTDSVIAAKRALLGENVTRNCLYFLNPKTATNSWIINNRTFYKTIGNHDFYL